MRDIHVDDRFVGVKTGKVVTVVQIDSIAEKVRYTFEESRVTRWANLQSFLTKFRPE